MKKFVGRYKFGKYKSHDGITYYALTLGLHEKPNFIKRFCMKHFLGFEWENSSDYEQNLS